MWGLVLKSLLQGTRWCNRISIMILGLEAITLFTLKSIRYVLMSVNLDFTAWLLPSCCVGQIGNADSKRNGPIRAS